MFLQNLDKTFYFKYKNLKIENKDKKIEKLQGIPHTHVCTYKHIYMRIGGVHVGTT